MRNERIERYMKLAEDLIYADNVDEGLRLMNELLYEEPGYGSLHNHLGWAYMYYTTDSDRAEMHLKMAVKFSKGYVAPYLHLGALYIRMGRYTEALEYLETGLVIPGANRLAFLEEIARVYELKQQYRQAVKAWKRALAACAGPESTTYYESIRRCRKKRITFLFSL